MNILVCSIINSASSTLFTLYILSILISLITTRCHQVCCFYQWLADPCSSERFSCTKIRHITKARLSNKITWVHQWHVSITYTMQPSCLRFLLREKLYLYVTLWKESRFVNYLSNPYTETRREKQHRHDKPYSQNTKWNYCSQLDKKNCLSALSVTHRNRFNYKNQNSHHVPNLIKYLKSLMPLSHCTWFIYTQPRFCRFYSNWRDDVRRFTHTHLPCQQRVRPVVTQSNTMSIDSPIRDYITKPTAWSGTPGHMMPIDSPETRYLFSWMRYEQRLHSPTRPQQTSRPGATQFNMESLNSPNRDHTVRHHDNIQQDEGLHRSTSRQQSAGSGATMFKQCRLTAWSGTTLPSTMST